MKPCKFSGLLTKCYTMLKEYSEFIEISTDDMIFFLSHLSQKDKSLSNNQASVNSNVVFLYFDV